MCYFIFTILINFYTYFNIYAIHSKPSKHIFAI
jgi:hypothetical protein